MKLISWAAFLALAISILALVRPYLWPIPKIGYAETSALLQGYSEAIQARKTLEGIQKEWEDNLKVLNDSLLMALERMKKDYDTAPRAAKDSLRSDLDRRNQDFQRYSEAVKGKSQEKEQELMAPVIKRLNLFMEGWGERHGYDLILGTMSGGNLLQANHDINVTAAILKELNETYRDLPEAGKSDSIAKTAPDSVRNPSRFKK
jgi:outer membrane protein